MWSGQLSLVIITLCSASLNVVEGQKSCPNIGDIEAAVNISQGFYFEAPCQTLTKSNAEKVCTDEGGWLAELKDQELVSLVAVMLSRATNGSSLFWNGLKKIEGVWQWRNGDNISSFDNWEETNRTGDCMAVNSNSSWIKKNCSEELRSLCQYQTCDNQNDCQRNYECVTSNATRSKYCKCKYGYLGESCSERKYGNPVIKTLSTNPCSTVGEITVEWSPGENAVGVIHGLYVWLGRSGLFTKTTWRIFTFRNLEVATEYRAQVVVCPNRKCISDFYAEETITTGPGVPPSFDNVKVKQDEDDGTCVISWSTDAWPYRGKVEYVKVSTKGEIRHPPMTISSTHIRTDINQTMVGYIPSPNTNYRFVIIAVSCAGAGNKSEASGTCYADNAPPKTIQSGMTLQNLTDDDTVIQIHLPDERNGPITCMFVIVVVGKRMDNETFEFSPSQLREASSQSLMYQPIEGITYTALSFSRSEIYENTVNTTLGDEMESGCDASGSNNTSGDKFFSAKNWPLIKGESYSFFTVVTTVNRGKILTGAGTANSFQYKEKPSRLWIIGLVAAAIIAIIITALVIKAKTKDPEAVPVGEKTDEAVPL